MATRDYPRSSRHRMRSMRTDRDKSCLIRAVVQYVHIDQNARVYDDPSSVAPESRSLLTQLLFSWKLNPQTVILAGYSDHHLGGVDPGAVEVGSFQQERSFFVKLGYAWVL